MTVTEIHSPQSGPVGAGAAPAPECEACGHALSSHDSTSSRFCRASIDRALDRNCICAPQERVQSGGESPMYGRGRFSGR